MTVKVRFDGRTFVPEQPLDLPVGTIGEIVVAEGVDVEKLTATPLLDLLRIVDRDESIPDVHLPDDLASQHDHYLYGTPKGP
jgi:hypothetical protein